MAAAAASPALLAGCACLDCRVYLRENLSLDRTRYLWRHLDIFLFSKVHPVSYHSTRTRLSSLSFPRSKRNVNRFLGMEEPGDGLPLPIEWILTLIPRIGRERSLALDGPEDKSRPPS